jgi:hypothetical protein
VQDCYAMALEFGENKILDAKFLNDESLLVLLESSADVTCLISFPHRNPDPSLNFEYESVTGQIKNMNLLKGACPKITSIGDLSDLAAISKHVRYEFNGKEDSFKPIKIEVTGRKSRGVCVLVGADGKQMRIYDIDGKRTEVEKAGESDVEMHG